MILFVLRRNLPETVVWLIQRGRFIEAKRTAKEIYGDVWICQLDTDQKMPEVKFSGFLKEVYHDRIRWRGTLFGWVAGWCMVRSLHRNWVKGCISIKCFFIRVVTRGMGLVL